MTEPSTSVRTLGLSTRALDQLMPMHLWIGPTGHVLHAGRTLKKVAGTDQAEGVQFFDLFDVRRPRRLNSIDQLLRLNATHISLTIKGVPDLAFKGVVVALPAGTGAFINLSFGISIHAAVKRFDLKLTDFAPSELAVEMLYLIEANACAMAESRSLNEKLEFSRRDAEEKALTDTLTGLRNRRAMDTELARLVAQQGATSFGLMHIDLDYFKSVNDTLGHAAGDQVLLRVAEVLRSETRDSDVVCRVGGDEFVVLLRGCPDTPKLEGIALRIIEALEKPISIDGQAARISASIGITVSENYERLEIDKILSDADEATYVSKNAGRGRHTLFNASVVQHQF